MQLCFPINYHYSHVCGKWGHVCYLTVVIEKETYIHTIFIPLHFNELHMKRMKKVSEVHILTDK